MRRVMIACVTFETVKVSDPAAYWGTNRIYLIHYIRDPQDPRLKVYRDFYEETCAQIRAALPKAEIIDVNRNVTDFQTMLRTVAAIIGRESAAAAGNPPEIYVNISAGPSEFITAAAIASMMGEGVRPFFVKTAAYQVPDAKVREVFYEEGRPVGMTRAVKTVERLPDFTIETPDEGSVRALRIFAGRVRRGEPVAAPKMVAALKAAGLWSRRAGETGTANSEAVYYQRNYIDSWQAAGWIERHGGPRSGYAVSRKGETILATFYVGEEGL